ncbi:TetR/AcrR family transcriptional regulator [Phreatobacter sp. AB_2022a]|uniref:TetR/AcrR family transcriptional regulator n=1 Tax=Phreatobacter sp. AB_2022a TaxID=3003134 RepID=UPI00228714B4|nr:TetR/AcrR family transcriptional regulator [Phreatobacter sp. AB_2022a]MCZ0734290.1 TetR/AcrR family transcriptional regulator [Phreatobacter sp. AB_2022a]
MTDLPSPTAAAAPLRRRPSQARSKERVERILTVARELIATRGSEALRMAEVADAAGISIGSLYQYFPDKAAIIRTLAERYNLQEQACIQAALDAVRDPAGLRRALAGLVDDYYALFQAEPAMRDIWSGTQADPSLRDIDLAATRLLGDMLAAALIRLQPEADAEELRISAFLTMHMAGATVRLAIALERSEGDALIAALKRMMMRELLPV